LVRRGLESFVERFVGRVHAQVSVQNNHRVARGFGFPLGAFEVVDVHRHQHHAVNLVIRRHVRPRTQQIAPAILVSDFTLTHAHRVDDVAEEVFQWEGSCSQGNEALIFCGR
jgi:hypothetical protein